MKAKVITAVALIAGLLAVCTPVFAHHANAAYDMTHVVVLKNAKVTKVLWTNPHIAVFFDVTDENGNVAHWVDEGGSPEAVVNQGWQSGTLKPGDMITTVRLFQAKNGTRTVGRMGDFTLPSGRVLMSFGGIEHPEGGGPVDCTKETVSGGSASYACIDATKNPEAETKKVQGRVPDSSK
jgi:hypothetical protein